MCNIDFYKQDLLYTTVHPIHNNFLNTHQDMLLLHSLCNVQQSLLYTQYIDSALRVG